MTNIDPHWTRRQTLRRGILTAGGLVVGGTALSGLAAAHEGPEQTYELPYAFTVPGSENPCTNEDIPIEVTAKFVVQHSDDYDHLNVKINAHGEGVGAETGTKWRWNDKVHVNINHTDGAETETYKFGPSYEGSPGLGNIRFISRGSADNLLVKGFSHITVNANSEVTAMKFEPVEGVCRG